jgi:DNA-binding NtrC family response regulator
MHTPDKIKIFLVDDDKMFAESLKHTLSDSKSEIKIFPTGEECLENLEKDDPEVVILDYYLNSNCAFAMNGIQVLNKIKQSNPDTKVIMLSSFDNAGIAADSMKYGAYEYITKEGSAMLKIKNAVKHINDSKEQNYDFDKEKRTLRRINIAIVAVIIIAYIINRLL